MLTRGARATAAARTFLLACFRIAGAAIGTAYALFTALLRLDDIEDRAAYHQSDNDCSNNVRNHVFYLKRLQFLSFFLFVLL